MTNSIKTIAKNTKLARSILAGNIKSAASYTLDNGFSGFDVTERFAEIMKGNNERGIDFKITTSEPNKYTVRFHSNAWIEVVV